MEKVIEILESVKPGVNYNEETQLIDDGILESFDIITIIAKLNEEFDVNFTVNETIHDNIRNIGTLQIKRSIHTYTTRIIRNYMHHFMTYHIF